METQKSASQELREASKKRKAADAAAETQASTNAYREAFAQAHANGAGWLTCAKAAERAAQPLRNHQNPK